jgi:hypothetical protein
MREDFLHYVWQYRKFDFSNLTTTDEESLSILNYGNYLQQEGPDFFNAKIVIGQQKWAGNIEIHVKSSDWYLHNHEKDDNYDNVILHVVWEHDIPIFRKDNTEIPVLEIRKYIPKESLENYNALLSPKSWIYCEKQLAAVDSFIWENWQERLFFERLERKAVSIEKLLAETKKDWEAVLFCMLAKNFGLNTNGETFLKIAKSIPFSVIRKESFEVEDLESLLFGSADLFPVDIQDRYTQNLKNKFEYLMQKYKLKNAMVEPVQFFKHRPDNFPTIRLAELAMLYHKQRNLFSNLIDARTLKEISQFFEITISDYWETHYQFDKESPKKKKQLSKSFVDLLVINTIIPIQFAYAKSQGKGISESLLDLIKEVAAEKNAVIEKFAGFGVKAKNALETQSLLQLKNEYCNHSKCLQCAVGIQLLKE